MLEWIKAWRQKWLTGPTIIAALFGAFVLGVVGFVWGGWTTESMAKQDASAHAKLQVVAALVPICVDQAENDNDFAAKLTAFGAKNSDYDKTSFVVKAEWATMPGSTNRNRDVAKGCMQKLKEQL